jgi:hypothetical protein
MYGKTKDHIIPMQLVETRETEMVFALNAEVGFSAATG